MLKIKNVKLIVLLSVIILFLGIVSCYAVDLDLSDDLTEFAPYNTSNTNISNNNITNNSNTNTSNNNIDNNNSMMTNTTSTSGSTQSATVTNSIPESDLGLSNILNIFLIVIGILLILLSIAILIRLKK